MKYLFVIWFALLQGLVPLLHTHINGNLGQHAGLHLPEVRQATERDIVAFSHVLSVAQQDEDASIGVPPAVKKSDGIVISHAQVAQSEIPGFTALLHAGVLPVLLPTSFNPAPPPYLLPYSQASPA